MKQWSIHNQIMILALLPAMFVGIVLAAYFTWSQIEYINSSLHKHGQSMATQIAPASEYAVFSGNTDILIPTLRNALNDKDVVAITIRNRDNKILVSLSDSSDSPHKHAHSLWRKLIKTELLNFRVPITSQEVAVDDFNDGMLLSSKNNNPVMNIIGYVELVLTTHYSDDRKFESLNKGIMLTVIILVASLVLAIRVSRRIASPVKMLTSTVRKIASGDFRTRITQDAPGELGTLELYVNSMADELQSYRDDMELRIDKFTRELQQTLEELEIRNAELDITRSNALAANRAKSEFLANMSHEIRTPLGGIIGFTELLDNTRLDEQQQDYVTTIRKSAGNLLNIIDDILDLSKIESGKLEITPVPFNLLSTIEEVIDLLSPVAYEKDIELFYDLHRNTPRYIEADPVRIRQILINLIGNAIKFTEIGHVFLEIHNAPENGQDGVRFTVTDTGIGMNKASKQTLFHAFTQADTSITRRFGGTGLGLVITRKLTMLMNGSIEFDSMENEGSCFWFRIPVKVLDENESSPDCNLQGCRTALVSRNNLCRSAIYSMLEYWDCIINDGNIEADDDSPDITIVCFSLDDLRELQAGNPPHFELTDKHPVLAIISSNAQQDIELVRASGIDKVVFFSSTQSHIYTSICQLINNTGSQSRNALPASTSQMPDWSGINVLVVDDNAINLRLAEILLQRRNANVVAVSSGDNAIHAIRSQHFDIIFMDLHMPGLDGYATTKRIRMQDTDAPPVIIALTANAMPAEKIRIYESGMNDIMIKPISEQMMSEVIARWLDRSGPESTAHHQNQPEGIVFSMEEAEKFTAGNTALAIELANMLKLELPDYQKNISAALESNNHAELKIQVHKLHGATRCCGTPALREASENMERVLDTSQYDELQSAAHRLDQEIVRLLAYPISPD